MASVLIHIVTWNSQDSVLVCIRSALSQVGLERLEVLLTDNASKNGIADRVESNFSGRATLIRNSKNLGFCGAHNQGVAHFLEGKFDYLFLLNPDLRLEPNAISELVKSIESDFAAGCACPKLLRADAELSVVTPQVLDAAGMYITPALRHFDRGSNQPDSNEFANPCYVFGGSGAALLMKREFVLDMLVDAGPREMDKCRIHPELLEGADRRPQLLDEAFFAYREDADLAWRAQILGWYCAYVPSAVGYHERVVLPERRSLLPAKLNALGVRNRFLLQINNFSLLDAPQAFFEGVVFRNLLVLFGVMLWERTSLKAIHDVFLVLHRALERRNVVFRKRLEKQEKTKRPCLNVGRWFKRTPYTEVVH